MERDYFGYGHCSRSSKVILEGMPFSRRAERDAARELAADVGALFELLVCNCPDEVALARIAADADAGSHAAADRSLSLFYEVKSRLEPIGPDEEAIEVCTHDPRED